MTHNVIFLVLVLGFLVSWFPRVLPFILTRYKSLPNLFLLFLEYLPLAILFALTLASITQTRTGQLPKINLPFLFAALPTFLVAYRFKNLFVTVLVGVFAMAVIRFLMV
ncbi:AzlD domain-containing protein [Streptococcus hongkongensis]|nr:branched-chain amino acid permease [Streptococcus uberis]